MIKQSSTVEFFSNIYQILITDEELMRLLKYEPKGYDTQENYHPDPLDPKLPNLVNIESDDYWKLVDERVVLGEKTSDLIENKLCKIYIYEGRRRPVIESYLVAQQEVNIDIFIHESFDRDLRISRISDRINELIALERIAGFGKLEYKSGNPREAPTHYRRFLHQYTMNVSKK
ncbi:hypothetical protein B1B04_09270 [Lysinibacillus sp. KCTC 33748]|uniref:hypothetical protein n=1 Tax=unclassified Lysinibacillus TaxID=2636778 RepID=UPI0009A72AB1|nr:MULTISPECIES: hypothetical protein [unclassified Lysinibacillus]OXS74306.1 hypothetical protein B1B04_09270 [Lysinibacillus sp. KCTC 33748]SKB63995.1 hypothetical protein SAMN06295926_10536 [Lysinibacillus sp. AC-3]